MKAYFLPRVISYILDMIIITFVATLISFAIPTSDNIETLNKEYTQLQKSYIDKEITETQYLSQYEDIKYDLDYANFPLVLVQLVTYIVYYIGFQFYNKGQTFGKKLMKIKVVSADDSELTINNFVIRALIINEICVTILSTGVLLFAKSTIYYYSDLGLNFVQIAIMVASLFMVLYRKDGRGIHDLLANTKVVMVEEGEK